MSRLALYWLLINLVLATQGFATPTNTAVLPTPPEPEKKLSLAIAKPEIEELHLLQREVHLLFNPKAGQGNPEDELETIIQSLEPAIPVHVHETKSNDKDLQQQCKELVKTLQQNQHDNARQPIVVACGGDGTVSAVAQAVLHTGIPFGVIPRGTANAFATAVGIPTHSIEAACDTILAGSTRLVDAASCDSAGATMILLAGIGWEANMVKVAQGWLKRWLGKLAYIFGGVKETVSPKSFRCRVRVDGGQRTKSVKTHSITVAVAAPAGSVSAQGTGEVLPDDGMLHVTIQTCEDSTFKSLTAMAHLLKAAVVKEPTETDTILHLRAKEIEISCRSKQHVVVDGELHPKRRRKFAYRVLPKALTVITPPPAVESAITESST